MYRMPKYLEGKISDELYEELMDIAHEKCETFLSFGSPSDSFEQAVIAAALKTKTHKDKVLTGTVVSNVIELATDGCLEGDQIDSLLDVLQKSRKP